MDFKEIEIPVPWGVITGKSWGDEKNQLVIALHGYQDNANTFDRLIPLLPKSFNYLSLDLPSHGKSSHFIVNELPTSFNFVLSLKLVLTHLNREKYILIGHSFGAQIATFFAQCFPEYVEKLICLDALYFWPTPERLLIPEIRGIFKRYSKLHNLDEKTAPTYTFDEAVEKVMSSRFVSISEEAAKILIPRSLIPVGNNKYRISTGQHLKYVLKPLMSLEYQVKLMKIYPIKCPHLVIIASESQKYAEMMSDFLNEIKKNPLFEYNTCKGTHDVHIEHPDRVAPIVSTFLLKIQSKL